MPETARLILNEFYRHTDWVTEGRRRAHLTELELKLLHRVAEDATLSEAAKEFDMSEQMFQRRINNAMTKLQVLAATSPT